MSLMQRGREWFNDQRNLHNTITVTYKRGDDTAHPIAASLGQKTFKIQSRDGMAHYERSRDFIVNRADLITINIDEPAIRDFITETVDNITYTYKVTRLNNEPCWEWGDLNRYSVRIHTTYHRKDEIDA